MKRAQNGSRRMAGSGAPLGAKAPGAPLGAGAPATPGRRTEVAVIERKHANWAEDSPQMDERLIRLFLQQHPGVRIVTAFHSGVKHLLIIYEP